jgi:hypothetical protein
MSVFPTVSNFQEELQILLTLLTVGLKISPDADFKYKRKFFLQLSELLVSYSNLTSKIVIDDYALL